MSTTQTTVQQVGLDLKHIAEKLDDYVKTATKAGNLRTLAVEMEIRAAKLVLLAINGGGLPECEPAVRSFLNARKDSDNIAGDGPIPIDDMSQEELVFTFAWPVVSYLKQEFRDRLNDKFGGWDCQQYQDSEAKFIKTEGETTDGKWVRWARDGELVSRFAHYDKQDCLDQEKARVGNLATACRLLAELCDPSGPPTDEPKDLITLDIASTDYVVGRSNLQRDVDGGKLKSYRPGSAPKNAKHLVSRVEVEGYYRRRPS